MKTNIIIPKKIKVGFNLRQDTYTGMLGYVIYHDGKKWRKEPSWENWRVKFMDPVEYEEKKKQDYERRIEQQTKYYHGLKGKSDSWLKPQYELGLDGYLEKYVAKSYEEYRPNLGHVSDNEGVKPVEYPNEPLEGFVLNRKAGGYSTGWNHRQTYCRVYDPRGFEFEITIPNLLYILENANSTVGKGLEGKFIYGWDGKDLVLVPENAPEYKEMIRFTELQDKKVLKKDLVTGGIYITDTNKRVTYLENEFSYSYEGIKSTTRQLWFGDLNYNDEKTTTILPIKSIKEYTGEIDPEYADYMEVLSKNTHHTPTEMAEYKYTPVTSIQDDSYTRYTYGRDEYYILENGKYKRRYLLRYRRGYGKFALATKRYDNNYDDSQYVPFKELIAKTPIYKRTIVKILEPETNDA